MVLDIKDAGSKFPELLRAVEEGGEVITLCREGKPVAEIKGPSRPIFRTLEPDPELAATFAPGFDPRAPASEDEWPEEFR